VLLSLAAVACSSGDEGGAGAAASEVNAGVEQAATPTFLGAEQVADLIKISPSFPFGVTRRHAAAGPVLDARWGRHGGPLVTTQNFSAPASALAVHRWTLPNGVTDAATHVDLSSVIAPDLPAQHFWGVDGFVDLPFDSLAMHAYSSSGDYFPGEVLFYSKDYDRVVGRAHVNGYYSGVGVADGDRKRVVYSGLSGLSGADSTTKENALYGSDVCADSPLPTGTCASSVKLFAWSGNSGPVTVDADGNVFVAGFVSGSATTDAIYGLTKAQSFASESQHPATLAERTTGGTASLAAVTKPGSQHGFVIAKGHDGKTAAPSYALAYRSVGSELVVDGPVIEGAVVGTSPDASLSFFAAPDGHLWVAVELPKGAWLLELQPRP
jgi:hypothetical protein